MDYQGPLSMRLSRQEYWSRLPFPSPGDFPNPEIKPRSPSLQADSLPSEPPARPENTRVGGLSVLQCKNQFPPNPGTEPGSPALQADSFLTELQRKPVTYGLGVIMMCQCRLIN